MSIHTIKGIKIHTNNVCPPIPVRDWDWTAITDDFDADCDENGFYTSHPVGMGPTEQAAIDDLLQQLEDDE